MLFDKLFKKNIKYIDKSNADIFATNQKIDIFASYFSKKLSKNIELFKGIFKDDSTFIIREFHNKKNSGQKFALVFFDGMVDSVFVSRTVIRPILDSSSFIYSKNVFDAIKDSVIISNEVSTSTNLKETLDSLIYGDCILLIDGYDKVIVISSKGWSKRSIEEPSNEIALNGPHEGFNESILQNITLLRRRLTTPDLKVDITKIGRKSNTKVALVYIDDIVDKEILLSIKKKLSGINIDAILDSNYIRELITPSRISLFKTIGSTERPDTVCGKILEGRVAIIVDGSPGVLTVPYLFIEYFHTSDDYYLSFYYASFSRIVRILSFITSISIPAIYLSLITFHQKMIPLNLLISIANARQGVPFSSFIEILIFTAMFEILRESSIHMPPNINQALGVVGGLVVGQAAVEAKLISAPTVIIVALSGITGLMIQNLKTPVLFLRLFLLVLALMLGLFGYVLGVAYILIYLFSMKVFDVDYMKVLEHYNIQSIKDLFFRYPWSCMKTRPSRIAKTNIVRQTYDDEMISSDKEMMEDANDANE